MTRYSQYRAAAGTVKEGWGLTQAYHHAERHDPSTACTQEESVDTPVEIDNESAKDLPATVPLLQEPFEEAIS